MKRKGEEMRPGRIVGKHALYHTSTSLHLSLIVIQSTPSDLPQHPLYDKKNDAAVVMDMMHNS